LIGAARSRRCDDRAASARSPLELFQSEQTGVPDVLFAPEVDVVFFLVLLNQIVSKVDRASGHIEMMIDEIEGVDGHPAPAEQLQQVLGVVATVLDPPASKQLASVEVYAVHSFERCSVKRSNLPGQLGREPLVSVEGEDPLTSKRQVVQRPLPL